MIRVLTFPDHPDALLIVVPDVADGPVHIQHGERKTSALWPPFTKEAVASAVGTVARVTDSTTGRWNTAVRQARNAERSERASREAGRKTTDINLMLGSADEAIRARGEVLARLANVEARIRTLKGQVAGDRRVFVSTGGHPGGAMQRAKELEALHAEERQLQQRSGELAREQRQRERREAGIAFRRAAGELLDPETLDRSLRRAEELQAAEDVA